MPLNRRQFLAGSVLGVAGAAYGGLLERVRPGRAGSQTSQTLGRVPAGGLQGSNPDWEEVRAHFALADGWVQLAGLLLSSHPAPVRDAIERHRTGLDANPAHYLYGDAAGLEQRVRRAAGAYMGVRPEDVALTGNTTIGLGLVYNGVSLRSGQELLTTTHDHRVTHESLEYRAARGGARLRRIPLYREPRHASEDEIVGNLMRGVRPETRVVAVTWVHSSTGVKLPIRAMADAVAEINAGRDDADRALLCVDGVHGLGVEADSIRELGCDFFIAGTHKWLFGPRGTGVIWGNPVSQGAVSPTIPTFTRDGTWGGAMTPGGFHGFEHRWALADAFEFQSQLGKQSVAERVHLLARQMKEGLAGMPHVTLYTPLAERLSSGIVCFDVRGLNPGQVVARLRERGIIASRTPYSPSYARFAPGLLNSIEDVEAGLAAVQAMG